MKGVDLSSHQSGISFNTVAQKYDFAILRGGFTGYGSARTKNKDESFETFYAAAKKAHLPVGCYWYSCAICAADGESEARFLYENCLKGKQFEFPIYIDIEEVRWQLGRKRGVTDAIISFCKTLEELGFFAGVYSGTYWFYNHIDTGRLSAFTKWVADWRGHKPQFSFNGFDMWQYTDDGECAGRKVDENIAYKDFPTIIKAAGLNGYKAQKPTKKTVDELAMECIEGKWGSGAVRRQKLTKAGYDYDTVQARVNEILEEQKKQYYTVKAGDTLTKIAKEFHTTVAKIVQLNSLANPNVIYAGQRLRVK